ncbi:MAG: hypothetical protein MI920_02605 [Kiloniellales bacterium]|nr:hypothetical protein [Kiloniellales bacterium]
MALGIEHDDERADRVEDRPGELVEQAVLVGDRASLRRLERRNGAYPIRLSPSGNESR